MDPPSPFHLLSCQRWWRDNSFPHWLELMGSFFVRKFGVLMRQHQPPFTFNSTFKNVITLGGVNTRNQSHGAGNRLTTRYKEEQTSHPRLFGGCGWKSFHLFLAFAVAIPTLENNLNSTRTTLYLEFIFGSHKAQKGLVVNANNFLEELDKILDINACHNI